MKYQLKTTVGQPPAHDGQCQALLGSPEHPISHSKASVGSPKPILGSTPLILSRKPPIWQLQELFS